MKKNVLLVVLIFSLSLNLAVVFTAGYRWWRGRSRRFPERPFLLEHLSDRLSPGQLDKIRDLREQSLTKAESLKKGLWEKRESLIEELRKAEPNRERVNEILRDISGMQFELEKEVVEDLLRMRELLPAEERERILNAMRERLKASERWKRGQRPFVPRKIEGR